MKSFLSIAVLALISTSSVQAIHHRAGHMARGHAKGDSKNKDIGEENIDPWVYDMVNPEVEEAAWTRPMQAPARASYTPYSAASPAATAAPAAEGAPAAEATEAPPAEATIQTGVFQNGQFRKVLELPNGQMMIQVSEEPAAEAKAEEGEGEAKAEAKEGDAKTAEAELSKTEEKKEEKKEAEAKEGEIAEETKKDNGPVYFDGNAWTQGMTDSALERTGHAALKWAN